MFRTLFIITSFLLSGLTTLAQQPLDDTVIAYYENENPTHLDIELVKANVCLERFLQLNPDLDITHIEYGQKMRLPGYEPCYQRDGYPLESSYHPLPRLKYYENGEWLDEPYYADNVEYIHGGHSSLEAIAGLLGVCVADLLAENILLQDFEQYANFTVGTSMDIFVPQGEPSCTPPPSQAYRRNKLIVVYPENQRISPRYFSETLNICAEEVVHSVHFYSETFPSEIRFYVPRDNKPCYNQNGERLRYYDINGAKLDDPVYSDLPIHHSLIGETMENIAQQYDVCLIDLLRINGFADMPLNVELEIFIPPASLCPSEIQAIPIRVPLEAVAFNINICADRLNDLNPHLAEEYHSYFRNNYNPPELFDRWIIIPANPQPCYQVYEAKQGESIYEIEETINVCHEEFLPVQEFRRVLKRGEFTRDTTIYIPLDALPCYNDSGQRLYYLLDKSEAPAYTDMQLYIFQRGDTVYSISQQFNVCVRDLLTINPVLKSNMYPQIRVFVPDTPLCYDEETGMPLIYENDEGQPFDEPQVSNHLIYYGSAALGQVSYYYNVCQNRIEDANRTKIEKQSHYLGWIIPTDRPPCYDADNNPIHYACYKQPIDMRVDYRQAEPVIQLDVDGDYCYDLYQSETVIWHNNKPYEVIYYHDTLLQSRAFSAWCYGVSLDEINAINADDDVLAMLPYHTRLIPIPTRDCYVANPEILNQHEVIHTVQTGETLSSIARLYNLPYQFIAHANDLDANLTIWAGQALIIPDVVTWTEIVLIVGGLIGLVTGVMLLYLRSRARYTKKKGIPKKREAVA